MQQPKDKLWHIERKMDECLEKVDILQNMMGEIYDNLTMGPVWSGSVTYPGENTSLTAQEKERLTQLVRER